MPTVYIIIYSLYHHVYKVAKSVQQGLEEEGVTVKLFQVPETLSDDILTKLHAPPKPDIPIITVNDLADADAFIFGVPTRFGTLPSQMKSFLDATGALWATGGLSGKFVGTFFSTASQHGGQETTAYTLLTYFAHHGLNYIPLGFANANLFDNEEVVGGSPYGSGTVANGDGSREPTEKELDIGRTQGENFARVLNTYHRGLELNADATETTETTPVDNTTNYVKTAPNGVTTNGVHEEEDREIAPVVGTAAATGAAAAVTAAGRVPVVTKVDDAPIQVDSKVTESINEIQPVKEEVTKSKPQEDPAVKKEDETLQKKEEVKEKSVEPEKPKPAAATKPTPAAATKPTATAAKKEEKSKCFCM